MKKILSMTLGLGIGLLALSNVNTEAKGRRCGGRTHHVSSHSRRIKTTKGGITRTRTIHIKSHRSH